MDISFDYYKTFFYTARCRSISKAAEQMHKGQPNITKTIANLEAQLGCRLFVRSARGVQLTPEGEKLYAHVAVAMDHILAGERELREDRSLQSGTVTIASSEIALRCCLLPVLEQFRALYPNVRVRLSNFSAPQAIEAVKNRLADFAIVTSPDSIPASLEERKLTQVQQVLVGGKAYHFLTESELSLTDLAAYPFICLSPQTSTFGFLSRFFAQYGLIVQPDIEVATAEQILPLIKSSLGLGFVPLPFLNGEEDVCRIRLKEAIPQQSVCMLKHRDSHLSTAAGELVQMLYRSHPALQE